jgi:uncharacterized protein (TIGR03067 family)
MKSIMVGFCCVVALSAPCAAQSADVTDTTEFQGKWIVQSQQEEGYALPKEQLGDMQVTFSESIMHNSRANADLKIRIDRSFQPYRIDFIDVASPRRIHARGIFEMKEDELRICWLRDALEGERPTKFASTEENRYCLMVLKRAK